MNRRPEVREQLRDHHGHRPHPVRSRGLDEGSTAERHHLSAQRACHVGHVDEADHEQRDQLRPRRDCDRTDVRSGEADGRAQQGAEEQRGERPDQVEQAADERVGPSAEIAGGEAERDGKQQREEHRAAADQERGAHAVQQADRQIAAVLVRPEEIVPLPGRADRNPLERDDVRGLAVDHRLLGEVVLGRRRVGDLAGVQRRGQRGDDDQREQRSEHQRAAVTAETAEGK